MTIGVGLPIASHVNSNLSPARNSFLVFLIKSGNTNFGFSEKADNIVSELVGEIFQFCNKEYIISFSPRTSRSEIVCHSFD